jgi:hypothetical protein
VRPSGAGLIKPPEVPNFPAGDDRVRAGPGQSVPLASLHVRPTLDTLYAPYSRMIRTAGRRADAEANGVSMPDIGATDPAQPAPQILANPPNS